jgi:hypothetical protein
MLTKYQASASQAGLTIALRVEHAYPSRSLATVAYHGCKPSTAAIMNIYARLQIQEECRSPREKTFTHVLCSLLHVRGRSLQYKHRSQDARSPMLTIAGDIVNEDCMTYIPCTWNSKDALTQMSGGNGSNEGMQDLKDSEICI